uniref:HMG domain-containing protein n=1 Tax=Erpetoichthys calabaricus TaxID=27687 RepID=A0A8C4XA75_ERPCA
IKYHNMYKCPLCKKKGDYSIMQSHLQSFTIYRCNTGCVTSGHFHCCLCLKVIVKRQRFLTHLQKCQKLVTPMPTRETAPAVPARETAPTVPERDSAPTIPAAPTRENIPTAPVTSFRGSQILQHAKQKKIFCSFCNLRLYKKNLKLHIKRQRSSTNIEINEYNRLPSVCIDSRRGIFAVAKTSTGPRHPIYVQKCTWGAKHVVICELEKCKRASEFSQRSGFMGFECFHLRSLAFSPVTAMPDITLQEEVLTRMIQAKRFGKETMKTCLHQISLGEEKSQIYLSVFEPRISFRSRLGRVMVHYNKKWNTWHCASCKPVSSCIHKAISKWHLFQTRPEHFKKVKTIGNDVFDFVTIYSGSYDSEQQSCDVCYPPRGHLLVRLVQYIQRNKTIPDVLPWEVCATPKMGDFPMHLIPYETFCAHCPGKVPLSDPIPITHKGKVIMFSGIVTGLSYYVVNSFLSNIHTAVERVISSLEKTNEVPYPSHNAILHAYLHFEALMSHDYNFSCVHCGHHPPIVIMDLHKKGVFKMAASDVKEPPLDFKEEVDMEDYWKSVEREILGRGFVKCKLMTFLLVNSCGWAVIICPCGVVYSVKFNIRAESPRDYADMLLSWMHIPNVVVYDFARGLVNHCKLREPEKPLFNPNEGRLAEATCDNIEMTVKENLKINLPWLNAKKVTPDSNGHPVTGSAEHYALYDTFHQYNTKDEKNVLRRISLVPELQGWINSQRAEQLFAEMRKNNYFLNMLSPSAHVFLMRSIIHQHNQKALAELRKICPGSKITFDSTGKAVLGIYLSICYVMFKNIVLKCLLFYWKKLFCSSASSFFSSFSSTSISCSSSNHIPSAFSKSPRNISSSLSSRCSRI